MSESDDLDAIRARKRELLREGATDRRDRPTERGGTTQSPTEPIRVEREAELEQLAATHRIVLADFYADWCGPCHMLEPIVVDVARETPAAVAKVDVDALPDLARKLDVRGVPSLFLYVDGEPAERLVGVQDYGTLESLVQQYA